ncbi:hypothetical protein HanIR_Chr12g0592801 [Helianthus annuus]|nr:hypothetical protein HanIR_Chr12g0592801 [Helianthus annuus]
MMTRLRQRWWSTMAYKQAAAAGISLNPGNNPSRFQLVLAKQMVVVQSTMAYKMVANSSDADGGGGSVRRKA